MRFSPRLSAITLLISGAMPLGCTLAPMQAPSANNLFKLAPGALPGPTTSIGVNVGFGSGFKTKLAAQNANNVKLVQIQLWTYVAAATDYINAGSNKYNSGNTYLWNNGKDNNGAGNTLLTLSNVPIGGPYIATGQAFNNTVAALANDITKAQAGPTRNFYCSAEQVTVVDASTNTYNPANGALNINISLADGTTTNVPVNTSFTNGTASGSVTGTDN